MHSLPSNHVDIEIDFNKDDIFDYLSNLRDNVDCKNKNLVFYVKRNLFNKLKDNPSIRGVYVYQVACNHQVDSIDEVNISNLRSFMFAGFVFIEVGEDQFNGDVLLYSCEDVKMTTPIKLNNDCAYLNQNLVELEQDNKLSKFDICTILSIAIFIICLIL